MAKSADSPAKGKSRGRKTKYGDEVLRWTPTLCQLGATNSDLAAAFKVNVDTIYEWKKKHPEFSEAIKKAADVADAKVVKSLYKLCIGYSHKEEKIFCTKLGAIIRAQYVAKYPPNITAIIFWLTNRRRDEWRRNMPEASPNDDAPLEPEHITQSFMPKPDK